MDKQRPEHDRQESATPAAVAEAIRRLAPECWAEDWDNPGWLVRRDIAAGGPLKVLVSLDPADPDDAVARGFHVNVCHHPAIFRPLRRLGEEDRAARAYLAGLNVIAAHTNLDVAPGGVNDALADALGLRNSRPLIPCEKARLVKFVTYVPDSHLDAVRSACAAAGAGAIGNYNECSFAWPGAGTFRPLPGADPYTGTAIGELERAEEMRLEMIVPAHLEDVVVRAAKAAHPYEEMAFDVIPLSNLDPRTGLGRIGSLPEPMALDAFCAYVGERLGTQRLNVAGACDVVRTLAVMGGSGGKHWPAAARAGADAFVTGEVGHHDALDAAGVCIVDAGHFATERPVLAVLADAIRAGCPGAVVEIAEEADPLRRA